MIMVNVYLEKYGKVLIGRLPDSKASAVIDYVCNEGKGAVLRKRSKEVFNKSKQHLQVA